MGRPYSGFPGREATQLPGGLMTMLSYTNTGLWSAGGEGSPSAVARSGACASPKESGDRKCCRCCFDATDTAGWPVPHQSTGEGLDFLDRWPAPEAGICKASRRSGWRLFHWPRTPSVVRARCWRKRRRVDSPGEFAKAEGYNAQAALFRRRGGGRGPLMQSTASRLALGLAPSAVRPTGGARL